MRVLAPCLFLLASTAALAEPSLRVVDAVKGSDRATVLSLLGQHADVNEAEDDGTTALQWAARLNDLELADRLLQAGANVNAANRYGVTALYLACVNGSAPMIE